MRRFLCSLCLGTVLALGATTSSHAQAQSAAIANANGSADQTQQIDIPKTLSYQGVIATANGQAPKDGNYQIAVTLYSDKDGAKAVWHGTYTTEVVNGVFNIQLGSGDSPLPDAKLMDGALYAGVAFNGSEEMRPLTPLSSSPFALNVADGAITAKKMGTDYVGSVSVNGQTLSGRGTNLNIVTDGIDATVDPASNTMLLRNTQNSAISTTKGSDAQSNTTITGTLTVTGNSYLQGQEYFGSSNHAGTAYFYSSVGSNTAKVVAGDLSAGSRIYTIPQNGVDANFLFDNSGSGQTISGGLTVNGGLTLGTPLAVGSGGTGANTLTIHGVVVGNGTSPVNVTAAGAANTVLRGTGASDPTFGTIDNNYLASGVYSNITGLGVQSQALDMGTTNKIVNLADPTAPQDAATKNYIDVQLAASSGFVAWDHNAAGAPLDQVSIDAAHDTYNAIDLTKNYGNIDFDDQGNSADGDLYHMKVLNQGVGGLGGPWTIALASELAGSVTSGHLVTVTTTAPHDFVIGEKVDISGMSVGGYNGTFTIATVPSATEFTYFDAATGLANDATAGSATLNAEGPSKTSKWDANGIVWSHGLNADNISNYSIGTDLTFSANVGNPSSPVPANFSFFGDYGNVVFNQRSVSLGNGLQDPTNWNAGLDARGRLYFNDMSGVASTDPTTSNTVLVLAPTATTNSTQILQGNMSGNLSIGGIGNPTVPATAGQMLFWDPTQNTGDYATAGGRFMSESAATLNASGTFTTTGNISTTSGGTITSDGTLTATNQLTGHGVVMFDGLTNDVSPTQMLTLDGSNDVRFTTMSSTALEGLVYSSGAYRLGGTSTTANPLLVNRDVNIDTHTLTFTGNGGANSMATLNGSANTVALEGTTVNVNNAGTGATNVGNPSGATTLYGSTIDIQDFPAGWVHINTAPTGAGVVVIGKSGASGSGNISLDVANGNSISLGNAASSTATVNLGNASGTVALKTAVAGGLVQSAITSGNLSNGDLSGDVSTSGTLGTTITTTAGPDIRAALNTGVGGTPINVAAGGTGNTTLTTNGVLYGNGASAVGVTAAGSQYNVLAANASGVPVFTQVALNQSAAVSGVLPIANGGTNSSTALSGQSIMISNGSAVVQGAAGTTTTVLHGNASGAPSYGAVSLTADVSGVLPIANGGTNGTAAPTNGGVSYGTGTAYAFSAAGSAGQMLQSAGAASPTWTTATYPSTATTTGTILRANGTNWVPSTATFLNTVATGDLLYGSSTNNVTALTVGANGTVLTSNGTVPSYNALTTNSSLIGNGTTTSFGLNLTHSNTWTADQTINANLNVQGTLTLGDASNHAALLKLYDAFGNYETLALPSGGLAGNRSLVFPDPGSTPANIIVEHLQSGGSQNIASLTLSNALPLTSGGTGVTAVGGPGSVVSANETATAYAFSNTPTDAQILVANVGASHTPTWVTLSGNASITHSGVLTVTSATNFSGTLSGDITGSQSTTNVAKLQGTTLVATGATNGEVLTWNGGTSQWEPQASSVSSLAFNNITSGTNNTGQAMVVGNTSSLDFSGTGTIHASTAAALNNTVGAGASVIAALTTNAGSLTNSTSGNAATATALQTARTINGVSFDGTGNITVTAAAGTLTGSTLAAGVTASSLTSVGTLANLTVTNPISGSVTGSAASFTGSLSGDVSGTQSTTSVNKIKGVAVSATAPTNNQVLTYNSGLSQWEPQTSSVSSLSFTNITGGTNLSAAMVVSTGSSLNYSASGTINASSLQGSTWASPAAIGSGSAAAGTFTALTATTSVTLPATSVANAALQGSGAMSFTSTGLTLTHDNSTALGGTQNYDIDLTHGNTWTGNQLLPANSTQGNNLIASINAGSNSITAPIASASISTNQLLATAGTGLQTANTGSSYTTGSDAGTYAGRVSAQNTSGGTLGTLTITVLNSKVTTSSVIIVTTESDSHSASGVQYIAQVVNGSRSAGTSFQVALHKATPTASSSFNNNEGCTFDYIVIN